MKKILHAHPVAIMITLLVVIVGVLIAFYFWAIGDVFTQVGRALSPAPAQSAGSFDLSGASALDLRGLMNTSTPPAAPTSTPY